jgi:hypothetical protein
MRQFFGLVVVDHGQGHAAELAIPTRLVLGFDAEDVDLGAVGEDITELRGVPVNRDAGGLTDGPPRRFELRLGVPIRVAADQAMDPGMRDTEVEDFPERRRGLPDSKRPFEVNMAGGVLHEGRSDALPDHPNFTSTSC